MSRALHLLVGLVGLMVLLPARPASAQPVQIQFLSRPAPSHQQGKGAVIEGHMLGASEVASVELFYRSGSVEWRNLDFELISGDHYRAVIPSQELRPPSLEYYVVAVDFLDNRFPAQGSAEHPMQVDIEPAPGAVGPTGQWPPPVGPAPDAVGPTVQWPPPAEPAVPPPPAPAPRAAAAPTGTVARPLPAPALALEPVPLAPAHGLTIIERERIVAMGARTLADVLEVVPELEITRDLSGFPQVAVRGRGDAGDVLLLLDGHVANNAYDGRALFDLPAQIIERVEVEAGPGASLAPALAGSVSVHTRDTTNTQVSGAAGSHLSHSTSSAASHWGTYLLGAAGGQTVGVLRITGFAGVSYDDGTQPTVAEDAYSHTSSISDAPGPAQDQRLSAAVGLNVDLAGVLPGRLSVDARYLLERRGGHVGMVDTYGPTSRLTWHTGLVGVRHELTLAPGWIVRSGLGMELQRFDRLFQLTPTGFFLGDRNSDDEPELFPEGVLEQHTGDSLRFWARVAGELHLGPQHTVEAALMLSRESMGRPLLVSNLDSTGAAHELAPAAQRDLPISGLTRTSVIARVQDTYAVRSDLDVAGGLRLSYLSNLRSFEPDKLISPRVEGTYRPAAGLTLTLGYHSTFRPATVAERTDQDAAALPTALGEGRYLGNPRLESTAMHTVEGGVGYSAKADGLLLGGRALLYCARVLDAIDAVPGAGSRDPETNLPLLSARSRIDQIGASLQARADVTSHTYVYLAGWWLRAWDIDAARTSLLTETPQMGGALGVNLGTASLGEAHLAVRYGSERRNSARTVLEELHGYRVPAYTLVHLTLRSRPLFDHLRAGLSVHNAFDVARFDPVARADLVPGMVPREGLQALLTVEVEGL